MFLCVEVVVLFGCSFGFVCVKVSDFLVVFVFDCIGNDLEVFVLFENELVVGVDWWIDVVVVCVLVDDYCWVFWVEEV